MRLPALILALATVCLPATAQDMAPSSRGAAGGGPDVSEARAERLQRIPALAPLALPSEAFALFTLDPAAPEPIAPEPAFAAPVAAPVAEAVVAPAARVGSVHSRAETVFYEVEGANRSALTASLLRHGPELHGRRFFGMTEWEISAGYQPVVSPKGCGVDDLAVEIAIRTHLPRWTADVPAPELHGDWERFLSALDEHEHGHRILAEEAAEAIRERLAAVAPDGCHDLDAAARRAMREVMWEYDARHLAYDAETGHGRTQGAVWPPPPLVATHR